MLVALGDVDGGLSRTLRLGNDCATGSLGGELTVHRFLHRRRREDLPDFDGHDLAAPALGHFVELQAQRLVDLLSLRQHLVERDVADDRAQGGCRHALQRAGEIGDVDLAHQRVDDLPVDEEVDAERSVVLGDGGLARDFDELLSKVDDEAFVGERDKESQARPSDEVRPRLAPAVDDHLSPLRHDSHGYRNQNDQQPHHHDQGYEHHASSVHSRSSCCRQWLAIAD